MDKTKLLLSTAVGLAFVVAGPAVAGVKHNHKTKAPAHVNFAKMPFKLSNARGQRKGGGLKEKFLAETWGVTTGFLYGGLAPVDGATSISCKKACTVVTNNTLEVYNAYTTGGQYNQVAICPTVDGVFTNGACYFSGAVTATQAFVNETNQTNLAVGSGTHTVETYAYTYVFMVTGHFQNDYHVYE